VRPDAAFWSKDLGEFVLPYDAVRSAKDPARDLMAFLQSTYAAAADLAKWDRAALECGLGEKGQVRVVGRRPGIVKSAHLRARPGAVAGGSGERFPAPGLAAVLT
jgi:hypothetical protein